MRSFRYGLLTLAFGGALLASTAALAGFKTGQQVVIVDSSSLANGELGYVRNSGDTTQYIGCYNYNNAGGCFAVNSAGLFRSCSTSDAGMLAVIRSLPSDGYLLFWWDSNGRCTTVEVETDSTTAPKAQ